MAKKLGARVMILQGMNFSALRDEGAKTATETWLLYIDADERVTDNLKKEIQEKILESKAGYYIPRKNYYLGCEWPTKDKMIRLIKKDTLVSWQGKLHEHPDIRGEVADLKEPLIHYTHRTLSEMVEKTNAWSDIEAELRLKSNHPPMVAWRFIRVMISAFWRSYIREGGWKAGVAGWIESIYQAFSIFITYAKLWERQQKHS
jgi:glycosyltransferase involved in cell wall biosynthesis